MNLKWQDYLSLISFIIILIVWFISSYNKVNADLYYQEIGLLSNHLNNLNIINKEADNIVLNDFIKNDIIEYETNEKDTIYSIALQFDIDEESIYLSNYNKLDFLKKESNDDKTKDIYNININKKITLLIPFKKGIVYSIKEEDNIFSISEKFDISFEAIIDVNKLISSDEITPWRKILIPWFDEEKLRELKKQKENLKKLVKKPSDFIWWNCTYYVAKQLQIYWDWNAKDWIDNAQKIWIPTWKTPKEKSIVVFSWKWMPYGHVWVVKEIINPNLIKISEMNYRWLNIVNDRLIDTKSPYIKGFIYSLDDDFLKNIN